MKRGEITKWNGHEQVFETSKTEKIIRHEKHQRNNGKIITNKKIIIEWWRHYFKELIQLVTFEEDEMR